jgi:hypothetical protein
MDSNFILVKPHSEQDLLKLAHIKHEPHDTSKCAFCRMTRVFLERIRVKEGRGMRGRWPRTAEWRHAQSRRMTALWAQRRAAKE